ncbi:MAG: hypothetical protein EPGJADBJ_05314 [Saprospiraceae bacterium]|nr:hypothetical protein [Saprospiraceae bacterium]
MEDIKALIRQGRTRDAIEQLQKIAGKKHEDSCIHLASRYEYLINEQLKGVLGHEEETRELQKINNDLLELIKMIEHSPAAGLPGKRPASVYVWLGIVLLIATGIVLYALWGSEKKTYFFNFESHNVPSKILDVLDSLRTTSENVRDISIDENYYWVILLGRDRAMWSKDVPPFLDWKIEEIYQQNRNTIRQVAMGPDSRWALLFNEQDYRIYPDVQDTLRKFLNDGSWRKGEALKEVAFGSSPGEFVLLAGEGYYAYNNIPHDLIFTLREQRSGIKSIALGPEDEWIMLTGKNDAISSNSLDDGLKKTLSRLKKEDREIRKVCLLKNEGWIVLTD